jgi:hypothetical protein
MYNNEEKSSITAGWTKLMEDGQNEAYMGLIDAIEKIDKQLGIGYAKEHPELIGAYMNTASKATMGAVIGKCILELRDSLDEFGEHNLEI